MEQNHSPGHHLLRTCHRMRSCMSFRKVNSDKMRHTHTYQEHKQEGDSSRDFSFYRSIVLFMLHDHTQYKCRQQNFDMDTSFFSIQLFTAEIKYLRSQKYDNGIEENSFPILPPVILIQLFPSNGQQHKYNNHHNNQLPTQTNHHDLKRDHQKNGIQIIKNSQDLNLLIYPAGL